MKDNMKKIYLFLLAAAGILAVASCAREELVDKTGEVNAPEEVTTLTFSFDATKTALVDGKTTWASGDKIRVYTSDGGFYRDVEVPEEAVGKASFSAEVNIKDSVYFAVYPIEASKGISGGKLTVNLPKNPDGRFDSANICVAVTRNSTFQMHNVTAVLKVTVNSGNVVELLQIIAQNDMVGDYAIGYGKDNEGKDTLNFTPSATSKSLTVAVGGVDGDYYIPVLPGTYVKDFSVTALRGNGGYQNRKTTQDNEVKINTLFDLGSIGDNLSTGLPGEGTAEKPFTISNQPEFIAFATSVTMGKTYDGQIVSLEADIEDEITKPAGYYVDKDDQGYFSGTFLGNNHSVKVDMDGKNLDQPTYVALFGVVRDGAVIKDLKVNGSVKATGENTAGIIGWACGTEGCPVKVTNCTSSVEVAGGTDCIGGIAGQSAYTEFENCSNEGAVSGTESVSGICGYAYYSKLSNCHNKAAVESNSTTGTGMWLTCYYFSSTNASNTSGTTSSSDYNNGTGAIAGWAQNSSISNCDNTATVTGYTKVGGIVGTAYWTPVQSCQNSGNIKANGYYNVNITSQYGHGFGSSTGGIVGWIYASSTVASCVNSGLIEGKAGLGGIVGVLSATDNGSSYPVVQDCTNTGNVKSVGAYDGGTYRGLCGATGGIVGSMHGTVNQYGKVLRCVNNGDVSTDKRLAGGIVGSVYRGNTYMSWNKIGYPEINSCVNNGNISGMLWVGGILGYAYSRYMTHTKIMNCSNHGTVVGNRTDSDGGEVIGGILGGLGVMQTTYKTNSNNHLELKNNYNDGDVLYAVSTHVSPYAGGIVGFVDASAQVANNYNVGYIGIVGKEVKPADNAKKLLGEIAGRQSGNYVSYGYYPATGEIGQPVGTAGTAAAATNSAFDETGALEVPIVIKEVTYETLVDVLNAWIGTSTAYYHWGGAPASPVHIAN